MINLTPDEHFAVALGDINAAHMAFRPPTRLSVVEGAAASFKVKRPGEAPVSWNPHKTNYMVEPMNMLASRAHKAVAFVGPAQSGKTAGLGEGWLSHIIVNDPGDMLMIQMTEAKAREYSKQRIDRMLKASDPLRELMSHSARDDNVQDKGFKHGMWLKIAWPTTSNLSSTSYRYVFITDIDRMSDDLDGEGDAFTLGLARPRTYLSRGKVCVESSPGRPLIDPSWKPATPHEGPPTSGIVGIYNRGDRRRWYWGCPDCSGKFEAAPGLSLFHLPPERQLLEEVRTANLTSLAKHHSRVVCPHCGAFIEHHHKNELNLSGRWLRDGQIWTPDGDIIGEGIESNIASFWLGGVAAAYQQWEELVLKHLQGLYTYATSGDEGPLQVTTNTDQAMPYMSRALAEGQSTDKTPDERAEDLERYVAPDETRSVIVAVDVQGGVNSRFICQAHAVLPSMEQVLINRWEIKESKRKGMGSEFAQIDPAKYPEDWDVLTEQIVRSTYRTSVEGREIKVKMTVVDSGGEAGATANAYAWYRRLRKLGLHSRVRLYKGGTIKNAPQIKETMVGARRPGEKGDIPLLLCNTNLLSDGVDAGLKRQQPGPNYIHFPKWLPQAFYDELTAEVRDNKKNVWVQIKKRNESFDLCRMIRVGMLVLGLDKVRDWAKVPDWLKPLAENSEVITSEDRRAIQSNVQIAQIEDDRPAPVARHANGRRRRARGRQTVPSGYVR